MPEHADITSLLTGSCQCDFLPIVISLFSDYILIYFLKAIHYFNCLRIVEILKETEKNSKNIFGMYSSQRMKDWNAIVSAYQKNNLYLAEAASILQRNVAYEIPALKKQINKCEQQHKVRNFNLRFRFIPSLIKKKKNDYLKECEEKHSNSVKSVNELNLQIRQLCAELGIKVCYQFLLYFIRFLVSKVFN